MLMRMDNPDPHKPDPSERDPSSATLSNQMLIAASFLICFVLLALSFMAGPMSPRESFAWFLSTQAPSELMRILRVDTDAPLHYLIVRLCTKLLGDAMWVMRMPTVIFATLCLPLVWMLARRMKLSAVRIAALLITFASSVIILHRSVGFESEVLSILFALASLATAVAFFDTRRWWWVLLFAMSMTGALWTNNGMLVWLVIMHGTWIWMSRTNWTRGLIALAIADHLILAMYIPWTPSLVDQLREGLPDFSALLLMIAFAGFASIAMLTQQSKRLTSILVGLTTLLLLIAFSRLIETQRTDEILEDPTLDRRTLMVFVPSELQLLTDYRFRNSTTGPTRIGLPLSFRANDPPQRQLGGRQTEGRQAGERQTGEGQTAAQPNFNELRPLIDSGQYDRVIVVNQSWSSESSRLAIRAVPDLLPNRNQRLDFAQSRWTATAAADLRPSPEP